MPIPTIYRRTPEGVIASYDWADVAEGSGIVVLYGAVEGTLPSGTDTYVLLDKKDYSKTLSTTSADYTSTPSSTLNLTFDLKKFNSPRVLKGTARFRYAFNLYQSEGGKYTEIAVKISLENGTTGEIICSVTSKAETQSSSGNSQFRHMIPLDVPAYHFKTGEFLRIRVEGVGYQTGANGRITFYHDPMDVGGGAYNTYVDFICNIPFRIDI